MTKKLTCKNCIKRFAEGFKAGQASILRHNESGCCCIIDDDSNVVSACGAHENWRDQCVAVGPGMVEMKTKKLTLDELKGMESGQIIEKGEGYYPKFHQRPHMKWIAICREIEIVGGWVIYYGKPDYNYEFIAYFGDKVLDEKLIRKLVPCTDEAWGMYRF